MLNIFKKKEQPKVLVIEDNTTLSKTLSNLYPKEVLEIHNEFETAADKLLLEANSIIDLAATKDVVKVGRLEKLGFKQAAQVTELKPLIQQATLSKEQLDLLQYYSFNYPNNKFITEEQVKTICHKYNLVCGDVSRFKGFVPEKNLKQVEAFNLKKEDIKYYRVYKFTEYGLKEGHFATTTYNSEEAFLRDKKDSYWRGNRDYTFHSGNTLQICAPVKDMDISGLELKEGYKLEKKHIPDPVVLQPVKGGYLILTAWGDEASDPLVVNQKFN